MEKTFNLRGGRSLTVGSKTLIMGVVNVTPDSFSDGGKYFSVEAATAHAEQLVADGADIIDVGAESTRPGSTPISVDEELSRLEKIMPALKNLSVPISIDTYKPEVAAQALEWSADIINDVHGLEDSRMIDVAKKFSAPFIAMHSEKCSDGDIIGEVKKFFGLTLAVCAAHGLDTTQIIFDPGIGFGKTPEDDWEILRRLEEIKTINEQEIPLMIGISRKSFIGWAMGLPVDKRDEATGALCAYSITKGVNIVRVHNVKLISPMCLMIDKLFKET